MLVPTTDPDYVAWSGLGLSAAQRGTMADLEATLANTYPPGTPRTYAADQRYRKASGGVIITSLSDVPFLSDPVSRNTIASAHDYAVANPGHITDWKLADGVTFIKLDEPQLAHAVQQIATFVQACFSCESTALGWHHRRQHHHAGADRRCVRGDLQRAPVREAAHGDRQHHDAERCRLLPAVRAADDRRHARST